MKKDVSIHSTGQFGCDVYIYSHAEFISASAAAEGGRLQSVMADADIHQHDAACFIKVRNL